MTREVDDGLGGQGYICSSQQVCYLKDRGSLLVHNNSHLVSHVSRLETQLLRLDKLFLGMQLLRLDKLFLGMQLLRLEKLFLGMQLLRYFNSEHN